MSKKRYKIILFVTVILSVGLIIAAFVIGYNCFRSNDSAPFDYSDVMKGNAYKEKIYVIGHKSPDTDTVISAITYAQLKKQLGVDCVPVVSGKINNETKFVLEYFKVPTPEKLDNAAKKNIILVDNSTYEQSIDGMNDANIVELIDHHGLGNIKIPDPIYIKEMPVGSTATIIYTSYIENKIPFDEVTAGLLVSAILSDTKKLTSVATTDADRKVCEYLANIAKIDNIDGYYNMMKEAAESYDGMTDEEIFYSDYKEYEMNGIKVGTTCINSSAGQEKIMCDKMKEFMRKKYAEQNMQHLYVLVCDKKNNQSFLFGYGEGSDDIIRKSFGELNSDGNYVFQYVASRKKDVVPIFEKTYSSYKLYG